MIKAILYSDLYRPLILCIISLALVFSVRNERTKTKIIAYAIYMFLVTAIYAFIIILVIIFTDFAPDVMYTMFLWGLKWISYFLAIIILQPLMYHIFDEDGILPLIFSLLIVFIPFYFMLHYVKML